MQLLALQINAEKYYFGIRKSLVEFDEVLEVRMLCSLGHFLYSIFIFSLIICSSFPYFKLLFLYKSIYCACIGWTEAMPCLYLDVESEPCVGEWYNAFTLLQ